MPGAVLVGVVVTVEAVVIGGSVVVATESRVTVVDGIDVAVMVETVRVVLPTMVEPVEGAAAVVAASESGAVVETGWGDEQLETPTRRRDKTATEMRLATGYLTHIVSRTIQSLNPVRRDCGQRTTGSVCRDAMMWLVLHAPVRQC